MSRLLTHVFCVAFMALACGLVPSGAAAAGSRLQKSMGNLRWGMTEGDVMRHVERQLKKAYAPMIKRASSNVRREDQLREELREKVRAFRKSLVEFDGKRTNWDVSDVAGEYTHGNSESMLVDRDGDGATHYFFINGRLWKWVKSYDSEVFGGKDFKKFRKVVSKKFGKGRAKSGSRNGKRGKQRWIEYLDRTTRLRAVDDTKFYDNFVLVFEEMDTVRDLASLRTNTIKRGKKGKGALADIAGGGTSAEDTTVVDRITGKDRRNAGKVTAKKRRSLFAEEQKAESEAEYRARVKRAQATAKAKQRRAHERAQRRKAGKALGQVSDNDDPLSGI